jgi:hypothetical protein
MQYLQRIKEVYRVHAATIIVVMIPPAIPKMLYDQGKARIARTTYSTTGFGSH